MSAELVRLTKKTKSVEYNHYTGSVQNAATESRSRETDQRHHQESCKKSPNKNPLQGGGELTGDGAEVEVVPDDLLQLVVHRALLEAQVEVVAQVLVYHAPWRRKRKRGRRVSNRSGKEINAKYLLFLLKKKQKRKQQDGWRKPDFSLAWNRRTTQRGSLVAASPP